MYLKPSCSVSSKSPCCVRAGHFRNTGPQIHWNNHCTLRRICFQIPACPADSVHTTPPAACGGHQRPAQDIRAQFLLRSLLVIVRKVAQEEVRQHVIAEVVRVHRAAQLVGDGSEGFAEFLFINFGQDACFPGSSWFHQPASFLRDAILFAKQNSVFYSCGGCSIKSLQAAASKAALFLSTLKKWFFQPCSILLSES